PGVAGRPLDDPSASRELAGPLGVPDHLERNPVLERVAGVERFELDEHGPLHAPCDAVDAHHRRFADGVQNRVADLLHRPSLYCGHTTLTAETAKAAKRIVLCGLGALCGFRDPYASFDRSTDCHRRRRHDTQAHRRIRWPRELRARAGERCTHDVAGWLEGAGDVKI